MDTYGRLTEEIIEELSSVLGPGGIITDDRDLLENYSWDQAGRIWGHMPEAVVRPGNTTQVSAVMKIASRYRIPVTPRGAGSGLNGGAVPLAGGIVLSLERMNAILEIDPVNRVAVVEPGVVTNDLCRAAAEKVSSLGYLGGNFATNCQAEGHEYAAAWRHMWASRPRFRRDNRAGRPVQKVPGDTTSSSF